MTFNLETIETNLIFDTLVKLSNELRSRFAFDTCVSVDYGEFTHNYYLVKPNWNYVDFNGDEHIGEYKILNFIYDLNSKDDKKYMISYGSINHYFSDLYEAEEFIRHPDETLIEHIKNTLTMFWCLPRKSLS